MSSVAPRNIETFLTDRIPMTAKITPRTNAKYTSIEKTLFALASSFCPKSLETIAAPPVPIMNPKDVSI